MAEPILKWAGGKRQLLDNIVPRLPSDYNRYFEPFFGGGALFFALAPEKAHINDINDRLMNFYEQVKQGPETIIAQNKKLDKKFQIHNKEDVDEDFYYRCRREFNHLWKNGECVDEKRAAVLLYFLNRSCWNGLYRTNEKGKFNVPIGRKPTPTTALESQIKEGYKVLQHASISSTEFDYIKDMVQENDLVFLDPPYPAESKTAKFDEYVESGFGEENQERVRDLAIELHERGVNVLITNGPSARRFYEGENLPDAFRMQKIYGQRMINSDSSKRTEIGPTDILVTNISAFGVQKDFGDFR